MHAKGKHSDSMKQDQRVGFNPGPTCIKKTVLAMIHPNNIHPFGIILIKPGAKDFICFADDTQIYFSDCYILMGIYLFSNT